MQSYFYQRIIYLCCGQVNHEKETHDGSLKLEHGTDAVTLVLGEEHSGRVRGAGKGITPTRYWNIPRRKGENAETSPRPRSCN